MAAIKKQEKVHTWFAGKVVRKDLTKLINGNAVVPTYVLEYLLGQYCATDDEVTINSGIESVRQIIADHYVNRDESQLVKSKIRSKGSYRVIDKVSVKLNEDKDQYEATFANLDIRNVPLSDEFIKKHQKLLTGGVWSIVNLEYFFSDEREAKPWIVESLKPIQISSIDMDEFLKARHNFTTEEWIDLLIHTIGLDPDEFSERSKLIQLTRLVPFVERNYNLIELGPKGTGKSHIFSELSPHGILLSGGEVTKAKLFVNNTTGNIGLVGYWDVVAYDEFAGRSKKPDRGLVDIMKNYMANKSFSRGTDMYTASASMAFVGNTDSSVEYMMLNSHLFDSLPDVYKDSAFLDRIHAYLPGWEVQKLRSEMFSSDFGFIVDYLAEVLKELRKQDFTQAFRPYFELSPSLTTRDRDSIAKTLSGLLKIIFPHGEFQMKDVQHLLEFAIEMRRRVKEQLIRIDSTFEKVHFSYQPVEGGTEVFVPLLEELNYPHAKTDRATSNGMRGSSTQEGLVGTMEEGDDFSNKDAHDEVALKEDHISIRDNQVGLSYEKLFAAYLEGATEINLDDPYVRKPYQFRNLLEFLKVVIDRKQPNDLINVHLTTYFSEGESQESRDRLEQIADGVAGESVHFTYEFDQFLHDRSIEMNNGWKVVLGRGLDIFQRTDGLFDIAELDQTRRKCKQCDITYVKL